MAALALSCALFACRTRMDPLYCDEVTPCSDPNRPFCDLSGSFPASDGIASTCIPDPFGGADGGPGGDAGSDAATTCSVDTDCPVDAPICDDDTCRACSGPAEDSRCLARGDGKPICTASGSCAACETNAHCSEAAPVCDSELMTCRACEANAECDSGVCDTEQGECASASSLIYVDDDAGSNGPGCGSGPGASACATVSGAGGAVSKLSASRQTIVFASGEHSEYIQLSGVTARLVGDQVTLRPGSLVMGAPLAVSGGADVEVDGLRIALGIGMTEGAGIRCQSSDLTVKNAVIEDNGAEGISADGCGVVVERSTIAANGRAGLRMTESSELFLNHSTVRGNAFQGLFAASSDVVASRNLIAENSAGGVRLNDCFFVLENNVIVDNGNQAVNPADPAGGVYVEATSFIPVQTFNHNTVADNNSPITVASAGLVCDTDVDVDGTGNILWFNERPMSSPQLAGGCDLEFSNVEGDTPGEGNIDAEPTFVSPATHDYHLAAGSAGIDVADPASPTDDDIDGETRPKGAGFDMGADER